MESIVWRISEGAQLAQGSLLRDLEIPRLLAQSLDDCRVEIETLDALLLTQSCDLATENTRIRAQGVWLCPVYSLTQWEKINPSYTKKGAWKNVSKGRVVGLHLLPPLETQDPRDCLCVDLRDSLCVPLPIIQFHAQTLGNHTQLQSPWLEDLSATFANLFGRVALSKTARDELQ